MSPDLIREASPGFERPTGGGDGVLCGQEVSLTCSAFVEDFQKKECGRSERDRSADRCRHSHDDTKQALGRRGPINRTMPKNGTHVARDDRSGNNTSRKLSASRSSICDKPRELTVQTQDGCAVRIPCGSGLPTTNARRGSVHPAQSPACRADSRWKEILVRAKH